MFALEITLRYKNQRRFYTNFGALTSLFIYLILASLLTSSLSTVLSKDPSEIQGQESKKLYINEDSIDKLEIGEEPRFFFAYRFVKEDGKTFNGDDNSIGADIMHVTKEWTGKKYRLKETKINVIRCADLLKALEKENLEEM